LLGRTTLMFFRLFSRAPSTRMLSCVSAACTMGSPPRSSGGLLQSDHIACGVTERAVPNAVGLVDRLLDHVGPLRLDGGERLVDIRGAQHDAREAALGHQFEDGRALL